MTVPTTEAASQYELRIHSSLVSGFHGPDTDECPEVFRGRAGVWIACNHTDHQVDAEGNPISEPERRVRLMRDVIPVVEAQLKAKEEEALEKIKAKQSLRAAAPAKVKQAKDCACGCGEKTKGGRFVPGHDAKLRGRLIKSVQDLDGDRKMRQEALSQLEELGWGKFVKDNLKEDLT